MENIKYVKTFEEAFTSFFKKESTIQKINPDIYEFAIRYSAFRIGLANACIQDENEKLKNEDLSTHRDRIESEETTSEYENHIKRFEIPELVFFGISGKVVPTHIHLTNRRAFWSLFGYFYTYMEFPSFMKNEIRESCLVQNRLLVELPERNRCINLFQLTTELFKKNVNEYLNNHQLRKNRPVLEAVASDMISNKIKYYKNGKFISLRKLCNQSERQLSVRSNEKLKSIVDSDGKLTVYRGFDIDKSENVRINRFKKNNPYSNIQESGIGMSFTPIKDGSKIYSLSKFRDTLTLSNKERVFNKSSIKFDLLDVSKENFLDTNSKIPVVGKYSASKKDILFASLDHCGNDSDLHSNEIVFFPDCVNLISYQILSRNAEVKIFEKIA